MRVAVAVALVVVYVVLSMLLAAPASHRPTGIVVGADAGYGAA